MKIKNALLTSLAATGLLALGTTVANADTVVVKAGDTVSEIALTHKTTIKAIQKANHLKNVNLIYIGDKLEVNGKHHATTVTTQVPTSAASRPVLPVQRPTVLAPKVPAAHPLAAVQVRQQLARLPVRQRQVSPQVVLPAHQAQVLLQVA